MMSILPGKIILKSSTSKTLSDRFGELAKVSRIENIRSNKREESYASIKNRRLAASMSNRLKSEEDVTPPKENVKSRLGVPMANRLGNKRGGTTRGRGKSRGQTPTTGASGAANTRRGASRGQNRGTSRGRGTGRGGMTNRGGRRGGATGRGGRGRGAVNQGVKRGKPGVRGAGRGRGRGGAQKPVTQRQLDNELEKYMSKTKSVLNAELDEYMKSV